MVQDKEIEIRFQFLEEANEYLDTLESAVLGLATNRIDSQKIDAALRAAHSIKGGAAMMGFETLSELAHRLEDSFKVLKHKRNSLEIDASLESILLAGIEEKVLMTSGWRLMPIQFFSSCMTHLARLRTKTQPRY